MEQMQTDKVLHILLVEDSEHDAIAFRRSLKRSGLPHEIAHVTRAEEALEVLTARHTEFDIVVSDYKLLGMTGLEMHEQLRRRDIEIPFVILTGAGSEFLAVEALRAGINDYIVKDSNDAFLELLPLVLPEVVRKYEDRLARIRAEEEKEELIHELREALEKIKTLRGLIPICAECHKIRDDQGYWNKVETYIESHSLAEFSHSICPDCVKKLYPEYYKKKFTEADDGKSEGVESLLMDK